MNKLTKTLFVQYTECPYRFWLLSQNPTLKEETTESDLFAIEEGFKFEETVQNLFNGEGIKPHFVFETERGYAEADIVKFLAEDEVEIYEVKASTSVKSKYIIDLAYQKKIAKEAGFMVSGTYLILANNDYVYNGDTISDEILNIVDVADKVSEAENGLEEQIEEASKLLNLLEKPLSETHQCSEKYKCKYITHQDEIPEYHIGLIPRLNQSKFFHLWNNGCREISSIPDDFALSVNQREMTSILQNREVRIDHQALNDWINALEYPIHFLDYETYAPFVTIIENYKPYDKMVFQYSLHSIEKEGKEPIHKEYLVADATLNIGELVKQLEKDIGHKGSVIVWNESFEKTCNSLLAEKYPEYSKFLNQLNERIVDQMKVFSNLLYYDYRFKGSTSIKNVLPVLIPELSYSELDIAKGDVASYRWKKSIIEKDEKYPRDKVLADLSKYCELDTLAMVEIQMRLSVLL
jgi:hypothetical protein